MALAMGLALFALASVSPGDEAVPIRLAGEVVRVVDGDTIVLLADREPTRIRLAQIDAPEMGQPYGKRAKSELSRLAFGKPAKVEVVDVDRYGRLVGEVYVGDMNVNSEMVRSGHAWAYTKYSRSTEIIELENEARRMQRGLWKLPSAQRDAPWEWRRSRRRGHTEVRDAACGAKRTCAEMANCSEAKFHHSQCGLGHLDGDGDGVPCEALCAP
jgi:endonuclease YncB( thermonuclease family)